MVQTSTHMHAASDREVLLLLSQQMEVLRQAVSSITAAQEHASTEMATLRDRVDQLWVQIRYLVAVLLFVVTPMYGAAIWSFISHVAGGGK
jgi:hypothetical protein